MDNIKPVKQDIVSTEKIYIKIEEHPIETESWQYPQSINSVKQEIVSSEEMDINIDDYPFEPGPWHYPQCSKSEMDSDGVSQN